MALISKLSEALGSGWIFGAVSGAAIVACCPGADSQGKEALRSSRQHVVHRHKCDRATARDVSNPTAGLQDQHAALMEIVTDRSGRLLIAAKWLRQSRHRSEPLAVIAKLTDPVQHRNMTTCRPTEALHFSIARSIGNSFNSADGQHLP